MLLLFWVFQEKQLVYKIFEDFLSQPMVTKLKKIDGDTWLLLFNEKDSFVGFFGSRT